MSEDRNLLFGVMAVQLRFLSPQELMEASAAWAVHRQGSLKDHLIEQKLITPEIAVMIEGLLSAQVEAHQGDVRATLTSFGGDRAIKESFAAASMLVADGKLESFGGLPPPEDTRKEATPSIRDGKISPEEVLEDTGRLTLENPGRYTVKSEHGRGGIGRVLLAFDAHIGREIAVKELIPDQATASLASERSSRKSTVVTTRFLREARITGQLEHPSIVPVYELGRRPDGSIYYTMKFVRGKTLAQAITESKTLEDRLKLLTHYYDLVNAVAYAHYRQVIHRDLKPHNVMVGEFGETMLIDWGLAKVKGKKDERIESLQQEMKLIWEGRSVETIKGSPLGTPAYMSPEQAEGKLEAVDERSDIWSLGAVLYEVLTGHIPFEGVNAYEIMGRVLRDEPPAVRELEPAAPPELEAVVKKCLSKDPNQRYQTAELLAQDIENFMTGRLVSVYEYPFAHLFKRWLKKWWPVAASVSLGLLVLLAVFIWSYVKINEEKDHALQNIAEAYSAYGQWAEAERRWGTAELYYSKSLLMSDRAKTRYALNYAHTAPEVPVRLKLVLSGNEGPVNSLAISPDGTMLAAGGEDRNLRIWDLAAGKLKSTLPGHSGPIQAIQFSPDGKYLASGGDDGKVYLWDPAAGAQLQAWEGAGKAMKWLSFSPSGELLAAAGENPVVQVWKTAGGQLLWQLKGHEKELRGVAVSPAGDLLASWGKDQTVRIWDLATGAQKLVLRGHTKVIIDAAFSPDGTRLISAGWDNQAKVWALPGGTELMRLSGSGPVRFVRVSPDNQQALVGFDLGSVALFDLRDGSRRQTFRAHPGSLFDLAVFPGFRHFATCGGDQLVRLWSFGDDRPANVLQGEADLVTRLAVSRSGGLLATAGDETVIRVWSLEERGAVQRIPVLEGRIWEIKRDPQGEFVAVAGQSGAVKRLDLTTREVKDLPIGHTDGVRDMEISADRKWLVTGSWDKTVGVWDLPGGKLAYRFTESADKLWSVVILPGRTPDDPLADLVAAGGDDKIVRVWRLADGKLVYALAGHTDRLRALAASPNGKLLASASLDKTARIWKLDAPGQPLSIPLTGHTDGVGALDFSPDGKVLVSGGLDNTVRVWDAETGKELYPALTGHAKWVRSVQFSQDGRFIISASEDGAVRIWEAPTGKLLRALAGTTDTILCLALRPDLGLIAVGSGDRLIRLWDPFSGELMHVLSGHPGSVDRLVFVGPNLLVSGDESGEVFLWPFADEFFNRSPAALSAGAERESGLTVQDMAIKPWTALPPSP